MRVLIYIKYNNLYIIVYFVRYILSKEINNKEKFSFVSFSLMVLVLIYFFFCIENFKIIKKVVTIDFHVTIFFRWFFIFNFLYAY